MPDQKICTLCGSKNEAGRLKCALCGGSRWPDEFWRQPLTPLVWRTALSADPTEHELLAGVRADPADVAIRRVYADWLLERGEQVRPVYVFHPHPDYPHRSPIAGEDPAYRAITSCDPIWGCGATGNTASCPRTWNALQPCPDDERARMCGTCNVKVHYIADRRELERAAFHELRPVMIDWSITWDEARDVYNDVRGRRRS